MATVNKNFRIKDGLVVEGTTGTINGEDILTTGSSTDDLSEGSTNKYYSTTQAKSDAADLLTGATLTNITITGDENGLTITAENGGIQDLTGFDTDDLSEGTLNKYYSNEQVDDHLSGSSGILTLAGVGNSNNENLTLNFEDTSNTVVVGSGQGVTKVDFGSISAISTILKYQYVPAAYMVDAAASSCAAAATRRGSEWRLSSRRLKNPS
jgi:hypothetical protein